MSDIEQIQPIPVEAPKPPAVGVHLNMPADEYHQRILGVASKGALDLVAKSPAHYKSWIDGAYEEEDTSSVFAFGKAAHCAILEPYLFTQTYAVKPAFGDCRNTANKAKRDEWLAAHDGYTVISQEDYDAVCAMGKAVRAHKLASKLLSGGKPEVTVGWTDDATGLPCKARADYWKEKQGVIVDLKTCADASPLGFRKSVSNFRYHVQDAHYRRGFAAVGKQVASFVFVAIEKRPPYAIGIYTLNEDALQRGEQHVRANMQTLAECMKSGEWPGYDPGIQTLELPPWSS